MGLFGFLARLAGVLLVIVLFAAVVVNAAGLAFTTHCQSLIAQGFAVVQVGGNCYAPVGDGKYMTIYNDGQPRTLEQIEADKQYRSDHAFDFLDWLK